MKLYGANPSPFFRKARVVLEEKGIPSEVESLVPVPKTPQLLALNPLGKIPILRDGEVVVPDSSVICAYLEKKQPAPPLYPSDPAEYARALFLEEYADTRLADVLGGVFFERFVKRFVLQQTPDEARMAHVLANDVPPALDWVEAQIPADRDTLLPRFGIADVALVAHLGSLAFADVTLDTKRWPRIARYQEAILARPSFKVATTR